jgi:hypothetical protein
MSRKFLTTLNVYKKKYICFIVFNWILFDLKMKAYRGYKWYNYYYVWLVGGVALIVVEWLLSMSELLSRFFLLFIVIIDSMSGATNNVYYR